ncbi:Enhancer of rudimentary homolog [Lemmus lemmus]
MKNIWKERIPTAPPSHISVSCLILLMIWQISAVLFTELIHTYQPYNKDWIKEKIYVLLHHRPNKLGSS